MQQPAALARLLLDDALVVKLLIRVFCFFFFYLVRGKVGKRDRRGRGKGKEGRQVISKQGMDRPYHLGIKGRLMDAGLFLMVTTAAQQPHHSSDSITSPPSPPCLSCLMLLTDAVC